MNAWDQMAGESQLEFALFNAYRNDRRAIPLFAKAQRRSEYEIEGMRRRWGWDERRAAYDNHLASISSVSEAERMRYHAAAAAAEARASAGIMIALEARATWLASQEGQHLDGREVARLAMVAQRARLIPGVVVPGEQQQGTDYSALTPEEKILLRRARELESKLT